MSPTKNLSRAVRMGRLVSILSLILILLGSCKTAQELIPVRVVSRDTMYLSNVRYDSVYIDRWQSIERKADTVFCEKTKTEYRYRLLRDTVFRCSTDTIPIVKEVQVLKRERYTPPFARFLAYCGIIALGAAIIFIFNKIKES